MPGPFPGIDPYIEAQGLWPDFHTRFITYCCDALLDRLPDDYEAAIEEQIQLFESGEEERSHAIRPDVAIVEGGPPAGVPRTRQAAGGMVLEPVTIPVAFVEMEEHQHTWIEIRRLPERSLVAVIEPLSPTNKYGPGRSAYLRKREHCLRLPIHLVELDFLLAGQRLPMGRPLPAGDCFAIVARAGRRPDAEVYARSTPGRSSSRCRSCRSRSVPLTPT